MEELAKQASEAIDSLNDKALFGRFDSYEDLGEHLLLRLYRTGEISWTDCRRLAPRHAFATAVHSDGLTVLVTIGGVWALTSKDSRLQAPDDRPNPNHATNKLQRN